MAMQSIALLYGDVGIAFQSLGVVYGDIGTSPMYVYLSTFNNGIQHKDDTIGVLSIIFYSTTLVAIVKYVFIILQATYNGDGGTFALYSLICRHANLSLIPSPEEEDGDDLSTPTQDDHNNPLVFRLKSKLENSKFCKLLLLFATMLGTCMVIGDILSAVGGIKKASPAITEEGVIWISIAILVLLFAAQRLGTDKVGCIFAPIICLWFALIGGTGIYNLVKYDHTVVKAINPMYFLDYFRRNKKDAWISLGGTVLSIAGSEALFADVGHFTIRTAEKIGDAYGVAIVLVMSLTSIFIVIVMVLIWQTHIIVVMAYCLSIGVIELVYFSSVMYKFKQGGYMQLIFAIFLMSIMYTWNYVYRKTYHFELDRSIPLHNMEETMARTSCHRLPVVVIFYSDMVQGIPPVFKHYLTNVPAVHSVLLFVSFKTLAISEVPTEKRFIFTRAYPADLYVFHCVVTYGYNDTRNNQETFERSLLERL
ncbi:Potassium transporter 22 [Capsicum annuum]|uniref:Potassium transporter 22 n=1 Tax=Capsicum annuum TaxID=4072 RepID=A0A2G2Z4R5_CAPAN|nr:Potassium transporter 22 [Capsicum annuum]PHT76969.1 Potassium transporter 22 [Capsicum annuum]